MRILEVNNIDLVGRKFNGYDLHNLLKRHNHVAEMVVAEKKSMDSTVIPLGVRLYEREKIAYVERTKCLSNVLFPYARQLIKHESYQKADVVHFHFPYHQMFSLMDYPTLMNEKTVWTIHDYWPLTGNCTNPLECSKWKLGCHECRRFDDDYFPMELDNTAFMWSIKKKYLSQLKTNLIVSTEKMKNEVNSSPFFESIQNVYVIPFGINQSIFKNQKNRLLGDEITIGFRCEDERIKGCHLLYQALEKVRIPFRVKLICFGNGIVPKTILDKYPVIHYGWIESEIELANVYNQCDIFVIPSLGETFCLTAVEAMNTGVALVCFRNTVVEEVTGAQGGNAVAVDYGNIMALKEAIEQLVYNKKMRSYYQKKGELFSRKYSIDSYYKAHEQAYKEICEMEKRF